MALVGKESGIIRLDLVKPSFKMQPKLRNSFTTQGGLFEVVRRQKKTSEQVDDR